MIQDIAPDRLQNRYVPREPAPESPVLSFREDRVLLRYESGTGELVFPRRREFPAGLSCAYLFSVGEQPYFLAREDCPDPPGYSRYRLRELAVKKRPSNAELFAVYTGWHLWEWDRTSRYCGCCGHETALDGRERAKVCPRCGNRIYPRINPAVIVGVKNGDRLLLIRYREGYGYNALVAGFTEIGETLEETVEREVMEEVGLRVKNVRYYKSQPWGIACDILAGYFCDVDGDDAIRVDRQELKTARWVPRGEIELQPADISLTNEMMRIFRDGREPV